MCCSCLAVYVAEIIIFFSTRPPTFAANTFSNLPQYVANDVTIVPPPPGCSGFFRHNVYR